MEVCWAERKKRQRKKFGADRARPCFFAYLNANLEETQDDDPQRTGPFFTYKAQRDVKFHCEERVRYIEARYSRL